MVQHHSGMAWLQSSCPATSGNVLDLWLFNIGWGHQLDLLIVSWTGSFHEFLVTTGSIQDPHQYLPVVLDQGPGYVESFGWMSLQTQFYQAIFHSKGALQSSHHHSLALCRYHLITGHYLAGWPGPHPRSYSNTSSSARCSIWRFRSTDALYACRISSPKMNFCDTGKKYPNFQWILPQGHCQENLHQDGVGFPR
jgi:hypothetical protein